MPDYTNQPLDPPCSVPHSEMLKPLRVGLGPKQPRPAVPCNGCGHCCQDTGCFYGTPTTPCEHLSWQGMRYVCSIAHRIPLSMFGTGCDHTKHDRKAHKATEYRKHVNRKVIALEDL